MLKFDQAPPFSVPLRFFLTAPLFALLAALVALWQGPALFESRWSPATLAVTHLLTLGVLGMVMLGAMMQVLPVLAGAPVARPRVIALLVHTSLTVGTLALAAGFLTGEPFLFDAAAALLAVAFSVFLAAVALSLARVRVAGATVTTLALAAGALGLTVLLGLWLAAARGGLAGMPAALRDLHPAWGFLGWAGLLVTAVACQFIPMFQMTRAYPRWMARGLAPAMLASLGAWSMASWYGTGVAAAFAAVLPVALYCAFAGTTFWLQARRRRRQPDVNIAFWRAGIVCAIAAGLLWLAAPSPMLVGVLAIAGALLSIITGMLYKIIPFLAWFHLQARLGARAPNVRQYLDDAKQRRQLWLHLAAVSLLAGAVLAPQWLAYPAAAAFAASALQWGGNLLAMAERYRKLAA